MSRASTKYLVDSQGRKKAVLLDMTEYVRLVSRVEELEDALDLDQAVRTAEGFRELEAIRDELKGEGRL